MFGDDLLGGAVEVAGAGVVAQAFPEFIDVVEFCLGQFCKRSANFMNIQLNLEPKYRLDGCDKHDANIQ